MDPVIAEGVIMWSLLKQLNRGEDDGINQRDSWSCSIWRRYLDRRLWRFG